ncbi:DUF6529 family protein [Parafrankia sp. EUN1f]|uniref:DUF6529 family protein n=1 Tax=Parafrankia sp. EUN1f TaxID=102897 RepID=UPI0001C46B52|nr:DUF6529 family protein [Parafrankia sp. EUN1f]EFC86420.1 hypothetical protein FrEUN1fDRAFT_0521 [Parafrankia sp. EUN1f]
MELGVKTDGSRSGEKTHSAGAGFAVALLAGAAVALSLGVYAKAHDPAARPLFTLGFSGMLPMKAWLTTAAAVLLLVQLTTALWMWGRLPGAGSAPAWTAPVHRWSGTLAFVLTLPVALHCIWALGFASDETRTLVHSLVGCGFYGAYAAKMLGLRTRRLPAWALPVLGSTVLLCLLVLWLSASLWFFTRPDIPKF